MAREDGKDDDASRTKSKSSAFEDGSESSDEDGKAVEVRSGAGAQARREEKAAAKTLPTRGI